jgi:AcrR family transcriptional regulator
MPRLAAAHESERKLILLKAAFREVAEKGFSNVTLEDIAARAGVSKGVTLYYSSKEDLFRELSVADRFDPRAHARGGRGGGRPRREGPRWWR